VILFLIVRNKGIFVLTFIQVLTPKYVTMTAIKESSTRNYNKAIAISACPVTYVMNKIGGHWKPIIIYHLMEGPKRYSELKRAIPEITEKMLIQHLKQLQADDLVIRKAEQVVPPVVSYSLSESGKGLTAVLNAMVVWGLEKQQQES
jgi:DNA-binding HxlR family transcriptional regulator